MQQLFVVMALLLPLKEAADVKFTTSTFHFNPKYFGSLTSSIGKEHNTLNVNMTLLHPIATDFYATIDLQIRLKDSRRYQSLFVENFDVCELANNVFIDNLMKKWYRNLIRYGNFMENCPVAEGDYFIRELMVDRTSLAMYLRPGDYRIVGRAYFRRINETILKGTLDIEWIK